MRKTRIMLGSFVISLLLSLPILAEDNVVINHLVSDYTASDYHNDITLQIRINNHGENNYNNVKLYPVGKMFSVGETIKPINVSHLSAHSESIILWTIKTPVAKTYFDSGMPVYFHLKAKNTDGNDVAVSLYSLGGI